MRALQVLVCVALAAIVAAKSSKRASKQPHIIWFFADDYSYHDAGYRNPIVKTPAIDDLVKNGISFTNAYTSQQCSPSRSSFLAGRYPYKSGMQHGVIMDDGAQCMDLKFRFISNYLKDLGYATHAAGKWHLGYCNKLCTPTYRGFDTFTGGYSGEGEYLEHTTTAGFYDWHNGTETDREAEGVHSQDLIEKDLLLRIEENDGTPMFYYSAFHNTHSPLHPKEEFYNMYKDLEATEMRKKYLGLISGMDSVIGKAVAKLKEKGMWENTYIFFSSDNGGDVGEGDNSPKRGAKSSLFDGGAHAHSFASGPLLKKKGVEADGLLHATDWLPSIVKLAGGEVPAADGIDGIEQVDLITNAGPSKRVDMIYNIDMEIETGPPNFGAMAARDLRWKLIWGFEGRSDGYGMDAQFIYDVERVKNLVEEYEESIEAVDKKRSVEKRSVEKRGGPYEMNDEQHRIFSTYVSMTTLSYEDIEKGTGPMMLFDLQEDPAEKNDLVNSKKPEHRRAKRKLIRMLRKAIQSDEYYKLDPRFQGTSDAFDGVDQEMTLVPGWCEDIYPGTD